MEGVEWTKVKYTQVGIHQETPWNIDLEINHEIQDCEIGTVCVGGGVGHF
jgi:hypothetical protein